MAVDLFTEASSSRGISPRISFSHDLNNCDIVPIEPHIPLKSSLLDYDFNFCVSRRSADQDSSLADELFANGVILPIQIKRKDIPMISKSLSATSSSSCLLPPLPPPPSSNAEAETEEKQGKDSSNEKDKSFWKFKRSKSLNCGRIYRRGLCSLPLLSRSKSTGSTASAKRSLISKDEAPNHHHQQHLNQNYHHHYNQSHNVNSKQASLKNPVSTHHQKPPLKKNYGSSSSFNSGLVLVNPVLNVPTGKFLGFGYIFSNGSKDKGKKK